MAFSFFNFSLSSFNKWTLWYRNLLKGDRLERVKEVPFKSERKVIQRTTESNLNEVFGFEFVKSELELGNLRIETLSFDSENKSFVIIEYKID